MKCVRDNPCVCANCDADPTDNFPIITVDAPESHLLSPPSMLLSMRARFSSVPLVHGDNHCRYLLGVDHDCSFFSCPLAAFPYQDEMEGCANDSPCHDDMEDYGECVADRGGKRCRACAAKTDWRKKLHLSCGRLESSVSSHPKDDEQPSWTCQKLHSAVICPMHDCCPECSRKLDRVVQCLQDYNCLDHDYHSSSRGYS
jgi:hypothetical protein